MIYYLIKLPILKRLIPSLIRKIYIFFGKEDFKIKFKNLIIEIEIRDPIDREIYLSKKYEERQFEEVFTMIKNNNIEIFLDVGANAGIYSLILSKNFKNLIIESFEPVSLTFKKFFRNAKYNNLEKNINFYNYGLSDTNSTLNMDTNVKFGYKQSAGYFVSKNGKEKADFKVADDILKYKSKNIFIKIDTEGHEKNVLFGMMNLIKNNNIFLQIEIWNKNFKLVNNILEKEKFNFIKKIKDDYYYIKKN